MAIDTLPDVLDIEAQEADEPAPSPRRAASAGHVLVAMAVCLGLWAFLFAPVLERGAEAGPVGARRAAALAFLRPMTALAEGLWVSRAADAVERALGRDPDAAPGGELELPDIDLPPLPAGDDEPAPTETPSFRPPDARQERDPSPGPVTEGAAKQSPPTPEPGSPAVAIREPEPGNKLRVAVVGDSLSQGLGPAVADWFVPELVRVLPLGRQSTGLARLDYFNWQAAMRRIEEEFRPDLVFVMLGSNDNQAQIAADGSEIPVGSLAWVRAYRERAARFLGEATSAGTRVVWVGVPVVQERQRWDFYRRVNEIYRDAAMADPFATYVDTWELFEAKQGGYTAYLRNERGTLQQMRAGDGIHFTPNGYAYLARAAIRAAAGAFALPSSTVTFRL